MNDYIGRNKGKYSALCVDPQSHRVYLYNLQSQDVKIITETIPKQLQLKILESINQLNTMMNFKQWQWKPGLQAQQYRRRVFPQYILKRIKFAKPCFIADSQLPKALYDKSISHLQIRFTSKIQPIQLDVYLVAGIDQIIKNIFRILHERDKIILRPQQNMQYCLKHCYRNQFLYGAYPLMNFLCIREFVQLNKPLIFQMAEIQKEAISRARFPPIIQTSSQKQMISLKQLSRYQILLWYPPFPFTKQNIQLLQNIANLYNKQYNKLKIKKVVVEKNRDVMLRLMKFQLNQVKINYKIGIRHKEFTLQLLKKRTRNIDQKIIFSNKNIIYSGQCQFQYRINQISLDNLFFLFDCMQNNAFNTKMSSFQGKYDLNYKIKQQKTKRDPLIKLYKKEVGNQLPRQFSTFGPAGIKTPRGKNLPFNAYMSCVRVRLYLGKQQLNQWTSQTSSVSNTQRYKIKLNINYLSQLMLQCRLCLELIVISSSGEQMVIASGFMSLFGFNNTLKQGMQKIVLWPLYSLDCKHSLGVPQFNAIYPTAKCTLYIKMPKFSSMVVWSLKSATNCRKLGWVVKNDQQIDNIKHSQKLIALQKILKYNPLKRQQLTKQQKKILMTCRNQYKTSGQRFAIYIDSVNWCKSEQILTVMQAKQYWAKLSPLDGLSLLNAQYADQLIRKMACQAIDRFSDDQLNFYMPQLVQALAYQSSHYSILGQVLLQRSILNPYLVGFEYFWQLHSQLKIRTRFERYALMIQQLICAFGPFRKVLFNHFKTSKLLINYISNVNQNNYQALLQQLDNNLPRPFMLPIDPGLQFECVIKQKLQIKDSKKKPISLILKVNNSQQIKRYIVKKGDDIRQDKLCLQIFQFMNKCWLNAGKLTQFSSYKVRSLNDQIGIIQQLEAQTLNRISSSKQLFGSLQNNLFYQYLKSLHPKQQQFKIVQQNFIKSLSCAIVGTYIMGIGDRHSSNVMLAQNGKFYHIDFGSILGNFKQKYNIKRQISPILFTQDLAFIIGGRTSPQYEKLSNLCGQLYIIARRNSHHLLNLLLLMTSAGLPNLHQQSNLQYCLKILSLQMAEAQARLKIKNQLIDALNNQTRRRLDNLAHSFNRKD